VDETITEAPESPNTASGSQTLGAKVQGREGNSPDHRLRPLNLRLREKGTVADPFCRVGLEAAIPKSCAALRRLCRRGRRRVGPLDRCLTAPGPENLFRKGGRRRNGPDPSAGAEGDGLTRPETSEFRR
jgi:hypothetical protein